MLHDLYTAMLMRTIDTSSKIDLYPFNYFVPHHWTSFLSLKQNISSSHLWRIDVRNHPRRILESPLRPRQLVNRHSVSVPAVARLRRVLDRIPPRGTHWWRLARDQWRHLECAPKATCRFASKYPANNNDNDGGNSIRGPCIFSKPILIFRLLFVNRRAH